MRIGVLGTGVVGRTLATKLVSLGHEVRMGSRQAGNEKAVEWAREAGGGAMGLALRPAARDLHASQTAIQLAALISKMFFGAFMLAGGVIGDIYGRRRILLWASAAVLVASSGAAFANSTGMLVAARALDGIANAALGPLSLALALAVFRPDEQSKVVSLYLGLSVLGVAFGPVIAGWLVLSAALGRTQERRTALAP